MLAILPLETLDLNTTLTDEAQWHTASLHRQQLEKLVKLYVVLFLTPTSRPRLVNFLRMIANQKPGKAGFPRVSHTSSFRLPSGLLESDRWKPTIDFLLQEAEETDNRKEESRFVENKKEKTATSALTQLYILFIPSAPTPHYLLLRQFPKLCLLYSAHMDFVSGEGRL